MASERLTEGWFHHSLAGKAPKIVECSQPGRGSKESDTATDCQKKIEKKGPIADLGERHEMTDKKKE